VAYRSLQDKLIVVADVDGGCHECNLAASITELSDGQEWCVGEGRHNVSNLSSIGQSRDV